MIWRSLSNEQWRRIEPLIPGKEGDRGRHGEDFNALVEEPDFEYLIIDSTIVRAHQHAAGAKKGGAKMRRSGVRTAA